MSNKKKILHINCNYMGTKLHQIMIEHLDPYVKENAIFCPVYSGTKMVTEPNENVVVSNCFSLIDRFFFYRKQRKIIKSIEDTLKISEYDCIHAYTLFTDGNAAYELSLKYKKKYVVAIRATDMEFFQYRPYLRKRGIEILINADSIFFLSETTRDTLYAKYIPKKIADGLGKKTLIVPNGIDDFWLNNSYDRTDSDCKFFDNKKIKICCVSEIIKRKNIPVLLKAVECLNEEGWNASLEIIGKATYQSDYRKIMQSKYATYFSPEPKEKLIEHYRDADIFVLPSKRETFGLVYAEAISQSLPVVYSSGEGFDGQFPDGIVGYSVNSDSYRECVEAILLVLKNYKALTNACIDGSKKFRWDTICKKYAEVYRAVCSENKEIMATSALNPVTNK